MTTRGKALVLYSLKNAVNELDHYDGLQPHRSFWVNRAHITAVKKKGREGRITMSNGERIPVSRSRMKEMQASDLRP